MAKHCTVGKTLNYNNTLSSENINTQFLNQHTFKSLLVHARRLLKMSGTLINPSPIVHDTSRSKRRQVIRTEDGGDNIREPIDETEVFDHIRDIIDPEHPYSLEQLNVVSEGDVFVDDKKGRVKVVFTPTVEHCSMATLIGLSIRVKLLQVLHPRFKVDIEVAKGSHASEAAINKQLNDKERVTAALENPNLINMVEKCLEDSNQI